MGNAGDDELSELANKKIGDEIAIGTTAALASGHGSSALAPEGMAECATAMGYAGVLYGSSVLALGGMPECASAMGYAGDDELGELANKKICDAIAVGMTAVSASGHGSIALAPEGGLMHTQ